MISLGLGLLSGCAVPTESPNDTRAGVLKVVVSKSSRRFYLEDTSGNRTRLSFPEGQRPEVFDGNGHASAILHDGMDVEIRGNVVADGTLLADRIQLATHSGTVQSTSQALATGDLHVAVVLIGYEDRPFQYPVDDVQRVVFGTENSLSSMFNEVSYSKTQLTGDVLGPYVAKGFRNRDCTTEAKSEKVVERTMKKVFPQIPNLAQYDHVISYVSGCVGGGSGDFPGTQSQVDVKLNEFVRYESHELGHNFGFDHSASLTCKSDGKLVPVGGVCTSDEYGDTTEPMGDGVYHFDVRNKSIAERQKSVAIQLVAGQKYRFSALAKKNAEGTSLDFLSVGWSKPGDSTSKATEVIPAKYLSPVED